MKTVIKNSVLLLALLFVATTYSQDKLDEYPMPVGGMEALIKNVKYPDEAKQQGLQGKVLIKAVVDVDGNVIKTEVVKSANELLDKAAEKAIKKTKFNPGVMDGKKVKAEVMVPVMFKLDDKKEDK